MMHINAKKLTQTVLLVFITVLSWSINPTLAYSFAVKLWPDGIVYYRYCQDDPACRNLPNFPYLDFTGEEPTLGSVGSEDKRQLRLRMNDWEDALTIQDPLTLQPRKYIQFIRCTNDCPVDPQGVSSYVLVRYNDPNQGERYGNMCSYDSTSNTGEKVGRNPNGQTVLHFNGHQYDTVVFHELGHCLGLWHEQQRSDHARWLLEERTPDWCAYNPGRCTDDYLDIKTKGPDLEPMLGAYDYDSIMHYPSYNQDTRADHIIINGELKWRDQRGNVFLGMATQNATRLHPAGRDLILSKRDISRVLQYYAQERYPRWGFFTRLYYAPGNDPDALPDPSLAEGVAGEDIVAVGTPAIAYQSPGNYDLFARGSDFHIYWKMFRTAGDIPSNWRSIGCCFGSDPSAVSRSPGRIDVVAINNQGEVQRIKHIDGTWYDPLTIRSGSPTGGIKRGKTGLYIGPAIASRDENSLDVFVVRSDGRLAVTTWSAGNWGAWRTLSTDYNVTARPAAVALSATLVQLAINENNVNLYEPWVTFPPLFPNFSLGTVKAFTAEGAPPALTKRNGEISLYRVLITNAAGRISHHIEGGAWRDIGGIPQPGTGPSAVATGGFQFKAVINGEDATGCVEFCYPDPADAPNAGGRIQAGGIWIRHLD